MVANWGGLQRNHVSKGAESHTALYLQEPCEHRFILRKAISLNHSKFGGSRVNLLNIQLLLEVINVASCRILGIYMGAVLFLSRFIRSLLIKTDTVTIIVEELPNVDKILNLCKNIYMVREAKQFSLEEDLVAQLLFLYRSPETLIKWSKYKHA